MRSVVIQDQTGFGFEQIALCMNKPKWCLSAFCAVFVIMQLKIISFGCHPQIFKNLPGKKGINTTNLPIGYLVGIF